MVKILLDLLVLVLAGHDIIDEVIIVDSVNQPLSLVAGVHGGPAELVITSLPLHETPDRAMHDGNGLFVGHDQDLTDLVDLNTLAEELTCWDREKGVNFDSTALYSHVSYW